MSPQEREGFAAQAFLVEKILNPQLDSALSPCSIHLLLVFPEANFAFSAVFSAEEIFRWKTILNFNQQSIAPLSPFECYWSFIQVLFFLALPIPTRPKTKTVLPFQEKMKSEELPPAFEPVYDPLKSLIEKLNRPSRVPTILGSGLFSLQHYMNHR